MAKILVITSGLTGILNASFELVRRLESAGHSITLSSPKEVGEKVKAQGLKYLQLDPVNFDSAPAIPDFSGPIRKVRRVLHKYLFAASRREQAMKNLGMETFLEKVDSVAPDLIVIDIELHEHLMTLVAKNYNVLLLSQWFSTWNRKGLPPIVSDIIPGVGEDGSETGIENFWKKLIDHRTKMFENQRLRSAGTDRRSVLLAYAKSIGFPQELIRENYWPGPVSYDQLPVLSMTALELEFPHDFRPNLAYVGPMVSALRTESGVDAKVVQTIEDIATRAKVAGKKIVYCSVSTFKAGDTSFLKKVVDAVANEPTIELIIGLGGMVNAEAFSNLPANVHAFGEVPQLQVLKDADLSINHGGIHTINECVQFGVPMLVYSGKRSDQDGCAARVHYYKVGEMADKDVDSPEEIKKKINQILTNGEIHQNLNNLRKQIGRYATDKVLENHIDLCLKNKPLLALENE